MVDNAGAAWVTGRHGEVQQYIVGVLVGVVGLHLLAQRIAAESMDVFHALIE